MTALLATGCAASGDQAGDSPDQLAFDDAASEQSAGATPTSSIETTTTSRPTTTTTESPPIALGQPGQPFAPLPPTNVARAIVTETAVVLPVLLPRYDRWMTLGACENVRYFNSANVTTIERAHVVIDPGHGGTEVGAVGPAGTAEETLNLAVSLAAKEQLEALGATVVLTRSFDHNITTATRGLLAKSIDPALFVSVHHNGGARRSGQQPGTIVFTKNDSEPSTRFGGLFYQRLEAAVQAAADVKRQAFAEFTAALEEHEAAVAAYDASVQARDAALVANGQVPATATTTPAPRPEPVDGFAQASTRSPQPTTTVAPTVEGPIPVPDTLPVPPAFALEPVREFAFAGGGNRGVRSWVRPDNQDFLSILRHSGDVPAALVEFLYVSNPSEEELLMDPEFIAIEAKALTDAIVDFFTSDAQGSGFVEDQRGDQPIGGGGRPQDCVEPRYSTD